VGRCCAFLLAVLALACALPAGALAGPTILVKFARPASADTKVAALGDDLVRETLTDVAVVDPAPGETLAEALATYGSRPDVLYAEPNRTLRLFDLTAPDDPGFDDQWALGAISALGGWSSFPGMFAATPAAPIAVVDTGVDATHEDLAGRISSASATCLSASCTAGIPTDDHGHGTHVSGIVGAATNNGLGVAGLAYASPLIVVRVFPQDASQGAALSDVADGIAWAAQHGAQAINLSLGAVGGAYPITLCNTVELAINSYHSVVVAAAGNGNPPGTPVATPTYPAACPGAMGVGATDSNDDPTSFSNYGNPDVFVSAPGEFVLSTMPGDAYAYMDGTSMASPFVTALAGLIRSQHPGASVSQVRQMLALSSDKVGTSPYGADPYSTCSGCTWEPHYGYGRINVQRALSTAVPPPPPPPPVPPPPPPPPPSPVADRKAPSVKAYAVGGRHGSLLKLRYRVGDEAHQTAEQISVYRKTRLLRQYKRPLRQTDGVIAYWVTWRAPRLRGAYRFCVRATDAAGNRSAPACAGIRVR
jgi:thermitase